VAPSTPFLSRFRFNIGPVLLPLPPAFAFASQPCPYKRKQETKSDTAKPHSWRAPTSRQSPTRFSLARILGATPEVILGATPEVILGATRGAITATQAAIMEIERASSPDQKSGVREAIP